MEFVHDAVVNKFIILFIFEKMDIALTESSILEICSIQNQWINYMECVQLLASLKDSEFIVEPDMISSNERWYKLTVKGRETIGMFYTRIPESIRNAIVKFAVDNKLLYKRNQEYKSNYYKNKDGSYTVELKILEPLTAESIFEVKIKTDTRHNAILAGKRWKETAASLYQKIYAKIVEEE